MKREKHIMSGIDCSMFAGNFLSVFHDASAPAQASGASCRPLVGRSSGRSIVMARYHGDIGMPCFYEFTGTLNSLLDEDVRVILLDFSRVKRFSHSAIGGLMSFNAAVFGTGKRLYLYQPSPEFERSLAELNVHGFFHFLRDEEEFLLAMPMDYP